MKRENTERRREKWSKAERWSVRESRLREIKRNMERWREKKSRVRGIERKRSRVWKVSLNIPSYTVELRGTGRRGALELAQASVKHRCNPV